MRYEQEVWKKTGIKKQQKNEMKKNMINIIIIFDIRLDHLICLPSSVYVLLLLFFKIKGRKYLMILLLYIEPQCDIVMMQSKAKISEWRIEQKCFNINESLLHLNDFEILVKLNLLRKFFFCFDTRFKE